MLTDRYGLAVSTGSKAARDAYVAACDRLLAAQPGITDAFDRAIAQDPSFALAHVGKARAHQLRAEMPAARAAIATATELAAKVTAREASHIAYYKLVVSGQGDAAVAAARTHLAEWPCDAIVLSPCASVFGLIGFSGRAGREREQIALLDSVARHYADDWWFNGIHAFGLMESGQRDAARPKIERAVQQHPGNANAAHVRAHMYYEDGEADAARAYLASWLPTYSRDGQLHGHISWHLALCELQHGDPDAAFRLFRENFAPGTYRAPGLFIVADGISFLWRAELAGAPRDEAMWQVLHDFAHQAFPHPAVAYADTHAALADAVTGDGAALEQRLREMADLEQQGRLLAGPVVPALSRGFAAFLRRDYDAAIAAITPILAQHERIGGSRAQRDVIEFTLLKAYLNAERFEDARRMLAARRPGPNQVPVAGVSALH